MKEYTIEGDELDQFVSLLEEGGYAEIPAYKLSVRVYGPGADMIAFNVNDTGWSMPMGRLTREVY